MKTRCPGSRSAPAPAIAALMALMLAHPFAARVACAAGDTTSAHFFTGGAECDVASRYLWRGLALSQGPVAQPSAWLSHAGFTLTLWGSGALDARDGSGFHELDPSLGYEHDLAGWSLKPSLYVYRYPGTPDRGTTELELVVSRAVRGAVNAFVRQTVDVNTYSGATSGACGLARESDAESAWTWTAAGQMSWGSTRFLQAYLGDPAQAAEILQGNAALTRHLGRYYVRLHAEADVVMDAAQREQLTGRSPFSGGAALGTEW